jgi:hypothetical protein
MRCDREPGCEQYADHGRDAKQENPELLLGDKPN